ncbi:ATP-binding protein [Plantactinospora soyae]|uniref:Tetratricopeptide (TPR) repeat protein n=1 Tax=Plantactinospora soyae TaxID=1544732 RepID=A0A927MFF4_9ACTN|nr:ATP-binding protein [Plantactinospora soyae]MBE1490718.1 tetratricopeptide (TPR) repeat protein [Plantactinospora soyae]
MRRSRSALLVLGATVLILGAWTAAVLLSPASTRSWTSVVLAISVVLTIAQVLGRRRAITAAVAGSTGRYPRTATPQQPARDYVVPFAAPPSALIIGRDEELDRILRFVRRREPRGPRVVVIHGPPGIGKTGLAVKAAHRCADDFADGVLFASLGGPVLEAGTLDVITEEVLAGFIDSLQGPDESIPAGLGARRDRFRQLTHDVRGRVLVVLDDAPDDPVGLRSLLPAGDDAAVLVTAREPLSIPGALTVELTPLADRHAISLLRQIVGAERIAQEEEAAQAIARRAAGSPLALQIAAASLVSRPYWTLAAAVKNMDLLEEPAPTANGSVPAGRSLDPSFAMLTQEERAALTVLGLLESATFAPWELAALLGNDVETAQRLSDRLVHARLVEHITDDATGVAVYRMLEHVRDYVQARLRAQPMDDGRLATARVRLDELRTARRNRDLQSILNDHVYPNLDMGLLGYALSHARDALAQSRENIEQARQNLGLARCGATADSEGGWPAQLAAIRLSEAYEGEGLALAALAELLAELGGVDDAFEMAAKALSTEAAQAAPRALRCQGKLQRRQRRLDEAEKTFNLAIEGARTIRDGAEEGRVWREMAILWACRGYTEEGLAAVDQAMGLDLREDAAARLLPSLLVSRAVVLLDAADRSTGSGRAGLLARADDSLCEARRTADVQGQRLWRAWIDYERARTAHRSGHFDHGRRLAFRAMEEFTQMRHRYGTARCRLEVGRIYLDQQRPQEALPVLEEARLTLSTCGGRWIEAQTAVVLAEAQEQVGRVGEAMRELALAIGHYQELGDRAGLVTANRALDRLRDSVPRQRAGRRGVQVGSGRLLPSRAWPSRVS